MENNLGVMVTRLFFALCLLFGQFLSGYITTIDCDTGSATGPELTLTASLDNAGSTLDFFGIDSSIDLHASDANANTIIGASAGNDSITGSDNIGLGQGSLLSLTTGSENTALGRSALFSITSGSENIAIGINAGTNYTTESQNICINSEGQVGDEQVLRIEAVNSAFIAGIAEATISGGLPIVIASDGSDQLGIDASSRKFLENIEPIGAASAKIMQLAPVMGVFKHDATKTKRHLLIAEDVHLVCPELVACSRLGEPLAVKYHDIVPMLLNELQKQAQLITELSGKIAMIEAQLLSRAKHVQPRLAPAC